jgi:class 3 adenylate cyclase
MSDIQIVHEGKAGSSPADERVADLAQRLLAGGLRELSAREQRVIATIADRHHVTRSDNRTIDEHEAAGDDVMRAFNELRRFSRSIRIGRGICL